MRIFNKNPEPTEPPKDNTVELLNRMQQMMQQVITPIIQRMSVLESQIGQQVPQAPQEPAPTKEPKASIFDNPENLDQMPLSEALGAFRNELGEMVGNIIEKAIKPLDERYQQTESNRRKSEYERAFVNFTKETDSAGKLIRPDWQDYQEEMFRNMKEKRGLTFEEAYDLAKMQVQRTSPERYQQIQEKHWPTPKEEPPQSDPFGGWMPSNIGFESGENMVDDIGQAAKLALDKVKEEWGPIPASDTLPS